MKKSAIREYLMTLIVLAAIFFGCLAIIKKRIEDMRTQYDTAQIPLRTMQAMQPGLEQLKALNVQRAADLGPVSEFAAAWPKVPREDLAKVNADFEKLALEKVLAVLDNRPFQIRANYPLGAEQIGVALTTLQVSGNHKSVHRYIGDLTVLVPTVRVESITVTSAGGDALTATLDLVVPLKDALEGHAKNASADAPYTSSSTPLNL